LNFVVTSHARYKIKHLIRLEERTRAIDLGRKVLEKEARRYDVGLKGLQQSDAFLKAMVEVGAKTEVDLFAMIGYGTLSAKQLLTKLVPPETLREKAPEGPVTAAVRRVFGATEEKIKVRGSDDVLVFRARCCNPIRGEKIVGYITRGKGVSVHSATCPNVVNLLYDAERRIDVEWDMPPSGDGATSYSVRLTMSVEDRKGVLAAVSAKIAGINTNITNLEARGGDEDHRARIDMTVEISDLKHLEKVMKSLRSVSGVIDVERSAR
jgi:GTP pyrophosphokinase